MDTKTTTTKSQTPRCKRFILINGLSLNLELKAQPIIGDRYDASVLDAAGKVLGVFEVWQHRHGSWVFGRQTSGESAPLQVVAATKGVLHSLNQATAA